MSATAESAVHPAVRERMAQRFAELAARILLATLFLSSGLGKIGQYGATAGYMDSAGVPGELLPIVIALEIVGALTLILGWKTRIVALLLWLHVGGGCDLPRQTGRSATARPFPQERIDRGRLAAARCERCPAAQRRSTRPIMNDDLRPPPQARRVLAVLPTLPLEQRARDERLDERLDEELAATFPASDPLPWRHGDAEPGGPP